MSYVLKQEGDDGSEDDADAADDDDGLVMVVLKCVDLHV